MILSTSRFGPDGPTVTLKIDPDKMAGVVGGHLLLSVNDGSPEFLPRRNPVPSPVDDEQILPFWSGGSSHKIIELSSESIWSPSFQIQHLCGYYYTPERYEAEAKKLESFGFHCLRSKRGDDGRYWEVWHLLGYWSATGALGDFCSGLTVKNISDLAEHEMKAKAVIRWLCSHCSFGSLDVTTQRAAMTMGD